ncbi:MAG: hypothetical protein A2583_01460, partial [Bdellovibrionales bacterium RIFOXYD1_FULL_53_11]
MMFRNGVSFDYPFVEAMRSMLPLVDELIVNVGECGDGTLDLVKKFAAGEGAGKVSWFTSVWPLDEPGMRTGGRVLAQQTNLALDRCTGDWCLHLQADEVFHEDDVSLLRGAIERVTLMPDVDGLLFDYVHLYGSFDVMQVSRSAYRREVRALKLSCDPRSVGDAQGFRTRDGRKLRVLRSGARVFHYGWVRPPEKMREKTVFMDKLYHGSADAGAPATGDNYRYKKFPGLKKFTGTHPRVMHERIAGKGWRWDLDASPLEWKPGDALKIVLDAAESLTGKRFFEYRNYRLAGGKSVPAPALSGTEKPKASLVVTTYEMPRHLALVCAALERQSERDFEILLCDDGSGPVTGAVARDFIRRAPLPVQYFWQEHKGFRKCRILNKALAAARGEIMIFLDGDCVPHRHYVRDHIMMQESGCFLAGRRVELGEHLSARLSPRAVRAGYFDWPHPSLVWSVLRGESSHLQRTVRIAWRWLRRLFGMMHVDDLKGCNYSVSRKALLDLNGFDEDYEGYGREDTDIELRLLNFGFKIKS